MTAPGDPANWTPEQAQAAQAELDELERTDPDVAAAAASYDRMVERVTGRPIPTVEQATRDAIAQVQSVRLQLHLLAQTSLAAADALAVLAAAQEDQS